MDGCLLTQQRLGSFLELSRQPWALRQLSWEAPRTVVDMLMGGQVDLR